MDRYYSNRDRMMDEFFDMDPFDRRHQQRRVVSRHYDEPVSYVDRRYRTHRFDDDDDYDQNRRLVKVTRSDAYPSRMGESTVSDGDREFKVNINVKSFDPEEVQVKVIDDKVVNIEAKHEEKKESDDGRSSSSYVSCQFSRSFTLPDGVKTDDVRTNLSSDGMLCVTVPKLRPMIEDSARHKTIPVSIESSSTGKSSKDRK